MSTEIQSNPGESLEAARVRRTSLVRAVVVCAIWVGTLTLGHLGEHGHWTSLIIALPIGFSIAAAAELWHIPRRAGG